MTLSRGLAIRADISAKQSINPGGSEGQLLYAEEHRDADGEPLRVPGAFMIGIPVFQLGTLPLLYGNPE